jgi:asparagine synthase (glutamine-hydrolysing)
MPGIVGFISRTSVEDHRVTLDQMLGCMVREPFYTSGTLIQKEIGLGIGWVCHKESYSDCLPIWNERKDVCLVFSGEHFADNADIETLRKRGRDCSRNDARWLVHLYEENGDNFFKKLNGSFSGVLLDCRAHKVLLFNDRYGLNRIYWHEGEGGFYFASEAKALLKVLPQLRQLDMAGFAEFFACGGALQNRTLFPGLALLPAASAWTFTPHQTLKKESYFKPDALENRPQLPASEYYEKLNETFTRILPKYFQGEQPVALSLTGGLDSRMIIAGVPVRSCKMPCYTFDGMYRECTDARLARQIAQVCGQHHEVIHITGKFFQEFPELARQSVYYSDGAMDVTGSVELFANRVARKIAPVRMTGNYGSEILRGNVVFKVGKLDHSLFDGAFLPMLKSAADTFAGERNRGRTSFIVTRQVPWYHHARYTIEQMQLTVRSPFLDNELVALAYQAPSELSVNKTLSHRYIGEHNADLAKIPTDRGVIGSNGVPSGKFAVFCQEFMPRAEYVYDYGMPQWLAKLDGWMRPLHVERLFLGRQKFYHFRTWYRDELSGHVKEVLLDPRTLGRPYLDGRRVEQIVTAHVKGGGNYTWEIHKLLTSELIQRELIEQR